MRVHIATAKLPGKSTLATKTLRAFVIDYKGRLLSVLEKDSPTPKKEFKPEFTIVPARWTSALQKIGSAQAWALALMILDESFKLKQFKRPREVILSKAVAGDMPRNTKIRAARELEKHGLIKILQKEGKQTLRVIPHL
jgi:hypothetical protein